MNKTNSIALTRRLFLEHAATGIAGVALTDLLSRDAVAQGVPTPVRVVGEGSNFSSRTHWFFSLKDATASLACVCFQSAARRAGFTPRDGVQVVCTGRVDCFGQYGKLQLYVDRMEPVGQGAWELKFRALCDELRRLGYFEEARKRPLPLVLVFHGLGGSGACGCARRSAEVPA